MTREVRAYLRSNCDVRDAAEIRPSSNRCSSTRLTMFQFQPPVVTFRVFIVSELYSQFGCCHRASYVEGVEDSILHILTYGRIQAMGTHPGPLLPYAQVLKVLRSDKACLVCPVLHHFAWVAACH